MIKKPKKISSFSKLEIQYMYTHVNHKWNINGIRLSCILKQKERARILIVTPRSSGSSPERHLFKRRIKALFYEEDFINKQYDYIIATNKNGIKHTFQDLKLLLLKTITI